jgi:lipid kinase YegS
MLSSRLRLGIDSDHFEESGAMIRVILHAKVAGDTAVRGAINRLRAEGHQLSVRVTWEPSDSETFAIEASQTSDIKTVVAGGGDGTLNAVTSGVLKSGADDLPAIGLLPLGTANDFARGCGIPDNDPYAALKIVTDQVPVPIDVGCCNDRYFINVATGGFGTDVTVETNPQLKRALGGAAYLLTGVSRLVDVSAREAHFTGPGVDWHGRFLAMAVGNARFAGGGVEMCPNALLDDGLLNLWIMPELPEAGFSQVFSDLLQQGKNGILDHLVNFQTNEFTITSDVGVRVNLDGEPLQSETVHFKVLPKKVRFHLPVDTPVFQF